MLELSVGVCHGGPLLLKFSSYPFYLLHVGHLVEIHMDLLQLFWSFIEQQRQVEYLVVI